MSDRIAFIDEPIETTLREAAKVLDMPLEARLPYSTQLEMMLLQAQIILEIAKRIKRA